MTEPLAAQYDPTHFETELYRAWEAGGLFRPTSDRAGPGAGAPYVIMMPPPNVTAQLHMGHGLTYTIQDALIRFERMRGRDTLWLPGTDHAGIATQNVVERLLAKEGKTRFDLGREAFAKRVAHFVADTGPIILNQLRALGASCDWSRTYFTLDADLSHAVREVFVTLYEKGLIYRGNYIINWCPRCLTALSNEEAEKEEVDGKIWRLAYPLESSDGRIVVATTRPETMLGDTAVAVHPKDPRYQGLMGQRVRLPLTDRLIPIVGDEAVDREFGTGAVKVTPAHDPTDFEIGQRHHLEAIDVMTPEAKMSLAAPERFQGLDRYEARRRVVAEFEALGLLAGVEPHRHAVGHCYRCDTVVEPRLSEQWFVRMAPLAQPALAAYRTGRLRFIPERRGEEYAYWMENVRDWCISRQLWWGHRIPVWYCDAPECGATTASRTDLEHCPGCHGPVRQDDDVLDTWFSSQLVPFSALGWPTRTKDLVRFYPGNTLVTAPEILFFWVARMVMIGLEFQGELPFTLVYLHGTVRDAQHRRMSKSRGNGIDPLDVIRRYGADALRYTLLAGTAVGTDLVLDHNDLETSFAPGRNFANKLWNAGRFLLSNLSGPSRPLAGPYADVVGRDELQLADKWIIARCERAVVEATAAYDKLRLNDAAAAAYHFIWSDVADWYIEQVKPRLYGSQPGGDVARAVLARTFDVALRLLHPIMPFITETLWQQLPGRTAGASISLAEWPAPDRRASDAEAEADFAVVQEVIGALRSLRAEYNVAPGKTIATVWITPRGAAVRRAIEAELPTIRVLSKTEGVRFAKAPDGPGGHQVLSDGSSIYVPLGDLVDLERECARLSTEIDRVERMVGAQEQKLANEQFVSKAPASVVDRERAKLADWRSQALTLREKREQLGCG